MEVMYAETSNAVMGALLVHDVRNPDAPANGASKKLENPLQVMSRTRFRMKGFGVRSWKTCCR
jgi:hypothetical protein